MLGAAGDGNVATIGEGHELECVFKALLRGHVARDDGESAHIQFRRIQREENGKRVVSAGVGINDYFLGSCRQIRGDGGARVFVRVRCRNDGERHEREAESNARNSRCAA